jgi:uncharacterized protein
VQNNPAKNLTLQCNQLNMVNSETIKKEIKRAIMETDSSATVILFGSRARESARDDSDWDILVLLDKPHVSIRDEQVFRHRLYDLELKFTTPISTFVYSSAEWKSNLSDTPLHKSIDKEGIIL